MINGTHESITSESWSPDDVMASLRNLGWAIPSGEHDAHELLHVLLNSLQEQQEHSKKNAGTIGGIGMASCLAPELDQDPEITPKSPISPSPSPTQEEDTIIQPVGFPGRGGWRGSSSALSLVELAQESSGGRHRYGSSGSLFTPSLGMRGRALSRSSLSLAPGSIWGWAAGDSAPPPPVILPPQPPPFTGTLVSRLSCERCGRRSPLRTERFDSLTLPLPEPSWRRGVRQHVRLHDLLAKLTQPERVQGVRCESGQCEGEEREHVRHVQIGNHTFPWFLK